MEFEKPYTSAETSYTQHKSIEIKRLDCTDEQWAKFEVSMHKIISFLIKVYLRRISIYNTLTVNEMELIKQIEDMEEAFPLHDNMKVIKESILT